MALTIAQIKERSAIDTEEFEVVEWSGTVVIKGISKLEQREIWADAGKGQPEGKLDSDVLTRRLFIAGMAEPRVSEEDYEALMAGYAGTIDKIVVKIMRLSHFGDDELKEVQKKFPVQQ